ncbi:MAG: RHS repeat-associated core domain-containing protein [Steroidobacteraceae bacterium]
MKVLSAPYTIAFTYQNRVTNLSKYVASGKIEQTKVLTKINVQSSGTSVRQYNLTYETAPTTLRDRLISIQECGGSAGTDCLRPTTVTWQNGQAGVANPNTSIVSSAYNYAEVIDIDGDGRTDLAYWSPSIGRWVVHFANSNGSYGAAVDTGLATAWSHTLFGDLRGDGTNQLLGVVSGNWAEARWNGSSFVITSTGVAVDASSKNVLADTDGDGRPDLVTLRTNKWLYIRLNTSNASAPSFGSASQAIYWGATGPTNIYADMHSHLGNGFAGPRFLDVNGDGRQDIVGWNWVTEGEANYDRFTIFLGNGSTFATSTTYPDGDFLYGFGNFNNDACTDLVFGSAVRMSACNGSASTEIAHSGWPVLGALDWDGDGRDDLIINQSNAMKVQRFLGSAFSTLITTGVPASSMGHYLRSDSNGDGLADLVFVAIGGGNPISHGLHNGANAPADLVTAISDGWGISASPSYVAATQNNYTKGTGAVFPDSDFQAPMYVVSQAIQSDGKGGTFTNSFWYTGARVNRQGRGFLGFSQTQTQDSRNGLYRRVHYRQDFPYVGGVSQDDSFQPDGTSLISRTANTYQVTDLGGVGCASGRCFPYVSSSTTTNYEITGGNPLIQTTVSSFTYDSYGNATQVSTTTTDNHSASPFYGQSWSSVVSHTITNNTTNWCLGKPTVTTTQNTVPGQSAATRRVDHAVDYVNCRYTSETIEPGSTLLKVETSFGFDTCGNTNSVSVVGRDKTGAVMPARTTTTNYGTRCQFPESVTNALSQTAAVSYRYDIGDKASTTDPNGVTVSWLYDNFARRTRETRADGTRTDWAYSDCVAATCWGVSDLRFLVAETLYDTALATVRTRQQYYDGLERLRFDEGHRVLGTWTNTQTIYDSLGRQLYIYLPYSSANNGYHYFTYDLLNRPLSDKLYNSSGTLDRTTSMAYAGLKTTLTDARGYVTQKWADVTGSVRRITDPSPGGTTNHTFDPFGNLVQTVDATGATSSNTYNLRGFKTASSDPDAGSWTYVPNSLNELVSQTDAKGQVVTFDYDKLGRMTSRLEPESATATTWTYGTSAAAHNIGRLQSLSKPGGYAESYTFDSIGRPAASTYTMDSTSYQVDYAYNGIGAVDTLTYPTSTSGYRLKLKYVYSYGFLQQVKDNATGAAFWTLNSANDAGSPLTEVLGNGVLITSGYKAWTNELTSRKEGTGGSTNNLQDLAYQWDLSGNLSQRQDLKQGLTEVFVNDSLNRLTSSTLNGASNLSVAYNAAGNITSKSDAGSYDYTTAQAGCSYYAHSQPHAVRKVGSAVYCYDANGNVASRGGGSISWYSYNQPNQISYAGNSTQFSYDANHQRWKQVANYGGVAETILYIGGLLEKVTRSGVTEYRHRIPAGSGSAIYTRRDNGTASTYYVTTDHLGSGDLVMDSAANVLARESFTPFGARRGSNWQGNPTGADYTTFQNTTRRGFTGHEMLDAVSLVHMNGRVYDPYVGRFLSPDPIIQTLGLSQALNPFSYVMNNPLSLIDPSGYSWLSKAFRSIGNFFKKFWRPILAIVIAVVSFGYLAPLASQWLATSVCLMPGTITAGGAAIAGGISSGLSTIVMGGKPRDVLRSVAIGAAAAYGGFQIKRGIDDWAHGQGELYDVSRDRLGRLVIESVDTPSSKTVFVNGMKNDLQTAAVKALKQTGESSATLFYNPSHGFIADLTESFLMKITGTSSLGNQLAGVLQNYSGLTAIVAHSQGSLIVSNALGVLAQSGFRFASQVSITYYGSAANVIVGRGLAQSVGANLNVVNHALDAVGNIVGFNTLNPIKFVGSILASPTMFMGSAVSPHSVYP